MTANLVAGQRFGRLVVLRLDTTAPSGHGLSRKWFCQCDCGGEVSVCGSHLTHHHTQSCGCLRQAHQRRYGRRKFGLRASSMPAHVDSEWDDLQI